MFFSYIFNKNADEIVIYPQPRYEFLRKCYGRDNLQKILDIELNDYNKVIMYAPTFRNGLGEINGSLNSKNILNLEEYDEQKLINYLEKNKYLLILKMHPSEENSIKLNNKTKNIILLKDEDMLENLITINEVLNGIDLLVADYSSIYVDYINLLRPILFVNTDIEKYEKERGIFFNSNIFWFPGPQVNKIEEFTNEIDKLLNDKQYYKKERIEFNNIINNAAEMSCDKFIDEFICKLQIKEEEKKEDKKENLYKKIVRILKEKR